MWKLPRQEFVTRSEFELLVNCDTLNNLGFENHNPILVYRLETLNYKKLEAGKYIGPHRNDHVGEYNMEYHPGPYKDGLGDFCQDGWFACPSLDSLIEWFGYCKFKIEFFDYEYFVSIIKVNFGDYAINNSRKQVAFRKGKRLVKIPALAVFGGFSVA